jgi:hypothetical protein
MAITPQQQAKLGKSYAEITSGIGPAAGTIRVWGTIGTLEYIGLEVETSGLLGANGVDKQVTRKAHSRSRWLGDRVGSSVNANNATLSLYPSRRGSALPGTPIKIVNLDQKVPSGGFRSYTVNVDGDIGQFITWYCDTPHPFNSKIKGKSGNAYTGIVQAD